MSCKGGGSEGLVHPGDTLAHWDATVVYDGIHAERFGSIARHPPPFPDLQRFCSLWQVTESKVNQLAQKLLRFMFISGHCAQVLQWLRAAACAELHSTCAGVLDADSVW